MTRPILCILLVVFAAAPALGDDAPGAKIAFRHPDGRTVIAGGAGQAQDEVPAPTGPPKPPRPARHNGDPDSIDSREVKGRSQDSSPVWVGIRYWVELLRGDPRSPGLPVPPDQGFRSGDRVRLHFESNVNGYLSIFQLGSSGAASLLYPAPNSRRVGERVAAHGNTTIPDGVAWFRFDNQPGVERLLVVFAARAEQLERLGLGARLDPRDAALLIARAAPSPGRKDLVLETERDFGSEFGTFVVNLAGEAIVLPIELIHD